MHAIYLYIHIGQAEKYVCMAMVGIELMTFGIQISKLKFDGENDENRNESGKNVMDT